MGKVSTENRYNIYKSYTIIIYRNTYSCVCTRVGYKNSLSHKVY